MSTEPAHQRRGHGRQVFTALMEWFASLEVPRVDLRATPDGRALYEAFGFRELGGATMAWTAAGTPAPAWASYAPTERGPGRARRPGPRVLVGAAR